LISTADFKTGLTIELDGTVYQIVTHEFHKPGKGQAVVRTKLRDLRTGNVFAKTFRSGEKVERARVERKELQYLYSSGDECFFMDSQDYEQHALTTAQIGDDQVWLHEGETITAVFYEGQILGLEFPSAVERKVVRTDPGIRGDTATGGSKPALLEGGATVQVPLFVNEGDVIRVDTRSREYVERVK